MQINMKMPSSCYDCPFVKNKRTNDYGSFGECGILEDYETINLLEHSKHHNCPLIEQEPILDKIRAEIEQAADKQFQIAMGVADLNERYTHIQMENAYRHTLNIIDKYKTSPTGAEGGED